MSNEIKNKAVLVQYLDWLERGVGTKAFCRSAGLSENEAKEAAKYGKELILS